MSDNTNWFYFACVKCGQTLRTTIDNPSSYLDCGRCNYAEFRQISKVEYEAANGRFEIPE